MSEFRSSQETARVQALLDLEILDTAPEKDFDGIVELASMISGCPISLISLVDDSRQWFKAKVGLEASETPRGISFCTHSIEQSSPFLVPDASMDPRFSTNPLVTGDPSIRFYAGTPLITQGGHRIGTLCTIDRQPRELSSAQLDQLKLLADQAVRMMELRKANRELLKTRKLLALSNSRVLTYAEAMPQMAFIADNTGAITYFNQTFYDYMGLEPGEGQGRAWETQTMHHPDDLKRTIETWNRSVASGDPYEIEYRLRRADGEYRWHLGRARAQRDSSGRIVEWFGTNTDIHELRESQENLRKVEESLSLALTSADVGFWDWDAKTGFTTLSDSLMKSWGIDPTTFQHTLSECMERIHKDDRERVWTEIKKAAFDKKRYDVDYRVVRPDGTELFVNAKGEYFVDENDEPLRLTGVTIDMTDRKRAELEIREAREAAEQANAAKSAFLANMSHEIRTPLGAIMGFSELAQGSESMRDVDSYLSVIQRNSVQVLKIVDDILDLAKVEAGKVTIEKIEVDLVGFLADFASLMGFRARENGIGFFLHAETDLPSVLMMDPTRVRQVLTNAVGNAIKFTEKGHVTLHVCFHDEQLQFSIRDTGRGISPDQAISLFQAFVQADISTTRKFGGTGLGLVLTKRLCQAMGGDYVLRESTLGTGSHFYATLYAEPAPKAAMLAQETIVFEGVTRHTPIAKPIERPLAGVKVLVVEDSPDNQELLRIILEKQGANFSLAKDGLEGVEKALAGSYDIVLMDVQMPGIDGHEAVTRLRARRYKTPIIALTAHAMREEFDRAIRSGYTDYLTKPVNRKSLIDTIQRYVKPV